MRCAAWLSASLLFLAPSALAEDWPQWGGPERDFRAPGVQLAAWLDSGPEVLWRRPLGEGYSAVVAVGERLFTQYREGDEEVAVALAAESGETLWEHRAAPALDGMRLGYGPGPHSTPLVAGGRVFTVGVTGLLRALSAADGRLLWSHELVGDLGGTFIRRGYAASPLAYGDALILPLGGEGQAVAAFAQADGAIRWKNGDFTASPSSPVLIEVGGGPQVVTLMADHVAGFDPRDGKELWSHEHKSGAVYNNLTPLWSEEDGLLFVSSAYGGGSRVLRLRGGAGHESAVEEVWHSGKMKVHYSNAVRVGKHVYGASGGVSSAFLTAVDLDTGELAWKSREVRRANLLLVGDQALILESKGRLSLARLHPEGVEIRSRFQLLDGPSWTLPTLVDQRLYVRDRHEIMALSLP